MLNLNQVTLFCVDTRTPDLSIWAMKKCLEKANFRNVILVTDLNKVSVAPELIQVIQAPLIRSIEDYSNYVQSDLSPLIPGTHLLLMQWDSFIINPELWDDCFLKYDYIGAPWPHHPNTPVGNGGFSLRSKKLYAAMQSPLYKKLHPEDQSICIFNKSILENEFGIQIAPLEIAKQFAFEREYLPAFGFHSFFNFAKVLSSDELKKFLNIIPQELLGKVDTYNLIDDLYQQKQFELVSLLLNKSSPKGKMWKKHLYRWLRAKFQNNRGTIL